MLEVSDEQFSQYVGQAMDRLVKQFSEAKNVGIVIADDPTPEQREKLMLREGTSLFGLYEGIPLTKRNGNYSGVLPDKITIFKHPLAASVQTTEELQEAVHHTLWHEMGHHFGLDHDRINSLEN